MIVFGLTGGIACGKSTVTKTFRSHGIPIVDADIVARQVVEPGTFGLHCIGLEFGDEYVLSKGILDREALARLVFADKKAMNKLNEIMAPLISREVDAQIKKLYEEGNRIMGYDAALICEMGNADRFRPLIVVSCPRDTQIERLMSRNSLTRAEAVAKIDSQMPVEKKIQMADFVVDTSGTLEKSILQTEFIINALLEKVKNESI